MFMTHLVRGRYIQVEPTNHVVQVLRFTLWLFNIAMENGPFIDGLPGFTYEKW